MSKTVLKVREKFNYSAMGADRDDISIDGFQINAQKPKPRALSNLRTINGYGLDAVGRQVDLNSLYSKKNNTQGMMSPAPRRKILDDLSWEEKQKVLSLSMA